MNGETITLTDSSNARYRNFVIEGNSIQDGEPTPETPVEIESVENVEVIQCGKNLFNIKDVVHEYGNFDIEADENKMVLTATGTVGAQYCKNIIGKLDSAKNYTLSFKVKKTAVGVDGNPIIRISIAGSNNGVEYTHLKYLGIDNPVVDTEYSYSYTMTGYSSYRMYFYNNTGTPVSIGEQTEYYNIQLEEGNIATDWKLYKGLTATIPLLEPLRSLPNGTKDTIEKDGIHRRVGIKVVDGSEGWTAGVSQDLTNTNLFYHTISGQNMNYGTNIVSAMCNYFEPQFVWGKDFEGVCIQSNNGALMIRINKDRLTDNTLAGFKNWLQENPITIQYELANEIIESFTEDQQTACDNIINNGTYKTTTNIYSSNEVAPTFKVEYSKDLETIINNLG